MRRRRCVFAFHCLKGDVPALFHPWGVKFMSRTEIYFFFFMCSSYRKFTCVVGRNKRIASSKTELFGHPSDARVSRGMHSEYGRDLPAPCCFFAARCVRGHTDISIYTLTLRNNSISRIPSTKYRV